MTLWKMAETITGNAEEAVQIVIATQSTFRHEIDKRMLQVHVVDAACSAVIQVFADAQYY